VSKFWCQKMLADMRITINSHDDDDDDAYSLYLETSTVDNKNICDWCLVV
jgi:hypothetical protein